MASPPAPRNLAETLLELRAALRDPALLIWSLFVLVIPFYVFTSGLPQPGDMLIVPLFVVTMATWNGRLAKPAARALRTLMLFTGWIMAVNWTWALVLGNFGLFGKDTFILFPIYYAYNTCVFLIASILYTRHGARFLRITLNLVLASLFLQIAASTVIHRSFSFRGMGLFNNPNQLGFFALIAASILALGSRRVGFGAIRASVGLTACLYLALVSASRAAVLGIGILFALMLIANPRRMVVVALAILALLSIGGPINEALQGTEMRLENDRYPQLSFLQERGYDRILNNKEYWLLGAGEGGTQRFGDTTAIGTTEIHSSMGTLFFCYGVVGIGLFLLFLLRVTQGAQLRAKLMLLPVLSYMVAHQGLRSTSVWILFAVFVTITDLQRSGATTTQVVRPQEVAA